MDQTDVTTPNPCVLTLEEQIKLLALLKKTNIRLGTVNLPTAPVGTSVSSENSNITFRETLKLVSLRA